MSFWILTVLNYFKLSIKDKCLNINGSRALLFGFVGVMFLFTKKPSVKQRERCHPDKTHLTPHNKHTWKPPKPRLRVIFPHILKSQTMWLHRRRNKCEVCMISSIFLHGLNEWRKNYMQGTRDNFTADKSLMMSHDVHFSIWAVPNIDHWKAFAEMSPVKMMDAREAISHRAHTLVLQISSPP